MAGVEGCTESLPDKIGTAKIKKAITLEPMTEHLVWGKLQQASNMPAGSTVMMEPTSARSRPRTVMVGRTVALLRDDGWLPIKVINPFDKPITVKGNAKLADVYSCVELESVSDPKLTCDSQSCIKKMCKCQLQAQTVAKMSTAWSLRFPVFLTAISQGSWIVELTHCSPHCITWDCLT